LLLLQLDPAQNMVHPSESLQAKLQLYARYTDVAADHLTNLFLVDSNDLSLLPTNRLCASYLRQFLQDRTCHAPNHAASDHRRHYRRLISEMGSASGTPSRLEHVARPHPGLDHKYPDCPASLYRSHGSYQWYRSCGLRYAKRSIYHSLMAQ